MTRTDDVIKVSGIRLTTGSMEEVLSAHPAVAECAVFGVDDKLRGSIPIGAVVLKVKYLIIIIKWIRKELLQMLLKLSLN